MINFFIENTNERLFKEKMKMKKFFSRVLALVFALTMLVYSSNIAYAADNTSKKAVLVKEISMIAEQVMPNTSIQVADIIPIYDGKDICEYAINIKSGNTSCGYVIYNSGVEEISKFSMARNAAGFLQAKFNVNELDNKHIEKIDGIEYKIVDDDTTGNNYVASAIEKYILTKDDLFNIFYQNLDFMGGSYYASAWNNLPRYSSYGEDFLVNFDDEYCCATMAMLNVVTQYNCYNRNNTDNIDWAYCTLWSMGGVKKFNGEYVMDQTQIGHTVHDFAKWYGGKEIPYESKNDPTSSFFVNAINNGYSSIMGIQTRCGDGLAGHAMSVVGYKKFKSVTNGRTKTFLKVATGWEYMGDIEYILFDELNVQSTYGVVFKYSACYK